uniref:Uncharacterized protein n=1 Tax=Corethron hystrix TaxID=216773 RepID=A0A7S1FXK6_9STRA
MADIMSLMGILDRKYLRTKNQSKQEIYLRIHHDLMWDFGLFFSSRISMNGGELIKCDQHGIACCDICFADSRDMILVRNTKKWNILIVKQFKSIVGSETNVNLEAYRVNWYPLHIINSGSHYEASAILKCEDFLNSKIQENGIESCVRSMLSFVQSYEKSLNCNPFSDESPMISVIYFIHRYLSNLNASLEGNTIFIKEAAQSLVFLGIELQKFAIWSKSLDLFIEALYLLRSINYDDNHPITAHVLRRIDSCVLRNVVMVARNSPNKLRLKHVGPNISQGHKHLSLELSSHPGFGIVRCEGTRNLTIPGKNISYDFIFLAVGLKDSAIIVNYDGQSIQNESCGRLFYSTLASSGEGVPVIMRSQIQIGSDSQNNEEIKNAINIIHGASLFSIDPDGFIYPTTDPHLCLGIYPHPSVYLVDCESPNRAIFKFTSDLLDSKRVPAKDKCKQFENEVQAHNYEDFDGVKLELSSHPGMGLMAFSDMLDTPLVPGYKYTGLAMGSLENTLSVKLNEKNQIELIGKYKGIYLCSGVLDQKPKLGRFVILSNIPNPSTTQLL